MCVHTLGFRAVEFGAEVIPQFSKEQLVAAKKGAGVAVINMCAALGEFISCCVSRYNTVARQYTVYLSVINS